jgi:hypothetical protein
LVAVTFDLDQGRSNEHAAELTRYGPVLSPVSV